MSHAHTVMHSYQYRSLFPALFLESLYVSRIFHSLVYMYIADIGERVVSKLNKQAEIINPNQLRSHMYIDILLVMRSISVVSYRNCLKTTYMNGKANRRIDFFLDCLLRMEMDSYVNYMEKDILLPINHKLTGEHTRGMQIGADRVQVLLLEHTLE